MANAKGAFRSPVPRICAAASLSVLLAAMAKPLQSQEPTTVLVRPWLLQDSSLAQIYAQLLQLGDSSRWQQIVVREGQTLSGILYERYRVGDTYRGVSGRLLQDAVKDLNSLPADGSLQAGQVLLLPSLPAFPERPGASANMKSAQVWSPRGVSIEAETVGDIRAPIAPIWKLTLPQESDATEIHRLITSLGGSGDKAVWEALLPFDVISPAFLPSPDERIDPIPVEPEPDARPQPDDISAARTGETASLPARLAAASSPPVTLFVLDFFVEKCGHGHRVMDVVRQTLSGLGLADLTQSPRVVAVDIDVRTDAPDKRRMVERWVKRKSFDPITANSLLTSFDSRAKEAQGARRPIVSLLHYMATLDSVLSTPGARVVSSAFYVESPIIGAFASAFVIPKDAPTFLFSASGNDSSFIEELNGWELRQPQKYYFDTRGNHPLFMVGGLDGGEPFGVRSRVDPRGVPFAGQASGWGGRGTCISPRKHIGTSYATPSVAAALFGALHHWTSAGTLPRSPTEIINRFVTAVEPTARLSSSFAVPGLISMEKLIRGPGIYVTDVSGTKQSQGNPSLGEISFRTSAGTQTREVGGTAAGRVIALVVDGDEVLVSTTDVISWTRATLVDAQLDIPVAVDGCVNAAVNVCRIRSADEFLRVIRELTVVQ